MTILTRLFKRHASPHSDPLAELPVMPGGCFSIGNDSASSSGALPLAGLLAATRNYSSRHPRGDCTFLIGLAPGVCQQLFPKARPVIPDQVLDGLRLAPATFALLLRVLYGETDLIDHCHDLLLLEMLGLSAPAALALPHFPEWVESQLQPETLVRLLTHPMVGEREAGAAIKALMMHPEFRFSMLDDLPSVAQRVNYGDPSVTWPSASRTLSRTAQKVLDDWQGHAHRVVEMTRSLVAAPPPEMFFIAQLQRCIASGGAWIVPDEMAHQVAASLHVMGMANGLKDRNHWLVDLSSPLLSEHREEIDRSLERFAVQLWQEEDARNNGFGPSLWVNWTGEALSNAARRLLHGTQATLGNLEALSPLLSQDLERRGINDNENAPGASEVLDPQRLGLFESGSGKFRLLHDRELHALNDLALLNPA